MVSTKMAFASVLAAALVAFSPAGAVACGGGGGCAHGGSSGTSDAGSHSGHSKATVAAADDEAPPPIAQRASPTRLQRLQATTAAKRAAGKTRPQSVTQASYACPMHPEVTSVVGGSCPKCGMSLEPVQDRRDRSDPPAGSADTGGAAHRH